MGNLFEMKPLSLIDRSPLLEFIWEGNIVEPGNLVSDNNIMVDKRVVRAEYHPLICECKPKPENHRHNTQISMINIRKAITLSKRVPRVEIIGWTYFIGQFACLLQEVVRPENFYVFDALKLAFLHQILLPELIPDMKIYASSVGANPSLLYIYNKKVLAVVHGLPAAVFKLETIPAFVEWIRSTLVDGDTTGDSTEGGGGDPGTPHANDSSDRSGEAEGSTGQPDPGHSGESDPGSQSDLPPSPAGTDQGRASAPETGGDPE